MILENLIMQKLRYSIILLFFSASLIFAIEKTEELKQAEHVYLVGSDTENRGVEISVCSAKLSPTLTDLLEESNTIHFRNIKHKILEYIAETLTIVQGHSDELVQIKHLVPLLSKIDSLRDTDSFKKTLHFFDVQLPHIDILEPIIIMNESFASQLSRVVKLLPIVKKISEEKN